MQGSKNRGFTLIELMVTVAIAGVLASVALPSYNNYVKRSRVPAALEGLSAYYTRMEQRYQDVGNYGTSGTTCGVAVPTVVNFTVTCATASSAQNYTATATGTDTMVGYTYTITHTGARATTAHPKGANTGCWSMKGTSCDS